jgi:plasmid stabilization system protein ParE
MRYTVSWKQDAQARLAEIWLDSPEQASVSAAADEIDRILAIRPLEVGESRVANSRILLHSPLAVLYEVSDDDRRVEVWSVWNTSGKVGLRSEVSKVAIRGWPEPRV